ncbi:uncharacterized protein LOC131851292 [Achroia grisella]|uniref:uncharacterized protein LOC131851292 n=1 Tax=Achroia grisella TaxID=688607 RepID=UPI0027D27767|nr:uncharacterized protein LOC131851292 [Achroia grisella]
MGQKYLFVLTLMFCVISGVYSLECYVCRDCTEVTDDDVQNCEAALTTTSTSTTTITTSTESPSSSSPSTVSAEEETSDDSNSTTTEDPQIYIKASRFKRHVQNNSPCFCKDVNNCKCNGRYSRLGRDDETTYVCVKDEIIINGETTINRGCSIQQDTVATTCSIVYFAPNCNTCNSDRCNSAVTYKSSLVVLISVYLLSFV